jgi:hypothetical protein
MSLSQQPPYIVINYMYDPYFTETHIISYNPLTRLYTVETTEVLRRNNADIHTENHINQFLYIDTASLIHRICKYLPPVYTLTTDEYNDICETDHAYINKGRFHIQSHELNLHKWSGYMYMNGIYEDGVDIYLSTIKRSDLVAIVHIWLTTLREKLNTI